MQDIPLRLQPIPVIKAALQRAKQRSDAARFDAEFEANRQVIIWLESLLDERRAA